MSKTSFASDGQELLYGLKKITLRNWQSPDIPRMFDITGDEWVKRILEPQLNANVPEDVEKLFEIARGSMVYGWYYYALMTLASEQLYRVCELAAAKRCEKANIPINSPLSNGKTRAKTFNQLINDLATVGIISIADRPLWQATRELRNLRSHPKGSMILTPGNNATNLRLTCERINSLFP